MKTSCFALLSVIACTLLSTPPASANWVTNCDYGCPVNGCDPCANWPTFEIYGQGLYLQANASDLYYGVEAINLNPDLEVPEVSPNWSILEINPGYHWGFEVGTRASFSGCFDMNVDVNWERIRTKDTASFETSSAAGFLVGPLFDVGPDAPLYKIASGRVDTHFDQINLNFGKYMGFGCNLRTNFYGGVAFARIHQNLRTSYSNVAGTIVRTVESPSTYRGVGPQFGIDYDYRLVGDFYVSGFTSGTLLMGQLNNSTTYQSFTPELAVLEIAQPNVQTISVPNRNQVVPGCEQKLGVAYEVCFNNMRISLGIGYQVQFYINAIQTIDMTAPQELPDDDFSTEVGVFAVGFERTLSNYMLSGPYGCLNIQF